MPRHDFLGDANWGVNNSVAAGTYDGVIDTIFGGAAGAPTALGPFRYPTFIQVSVTGQVRQVPRALPGDNIVRNAWARPNDPNFWGAMGFNSNGGTWWAVDSAAVILRVVAPIQPFRNYAGGQPRGDASHCGYPGYALCWSWVGAAHLEFTRIHVGLTMAQTDTIIQAGHAVTFTAGMTQTSFPGNPYPVNMSELAWRWIPDANGSADTVTCTSASGASCTKTMQGSGKMLVSAYVNGEQQQQEIHINVVSVPCPIPNEPALNDSTIRRALMQLNNRSGWDLDPGAGIVPPDSVGSKRELAGDIFRRPNGTYYFKEDLVWSNECFTIRSGVDLRESSNDVKVYDVHTEPTSPLLPVYGCRPAADGTLYERWENDSGRVARSKGFPETHGGGSVADWDHIAQLPENVGATPTVSGLVIQADGTIWKLPAELLKQPQYIRDKNRINWRWMSNTNPACNWPR